MIGPRVHSLATGGHRTLAAGRSNMKHPLSKKLPQIFIPRLNKLEQTFAILIAVDIFLFFWIDACFPQHRDLLADKNRLLEQITSLIFLASFIVGLCCTLWLPRGRQRKVYLAIPIIGLFGFLEEISYGTAFFKVDVPKVTDVNIDSLHDFLSVLYEFLGTYILVLFFLIFFFIFKKYGRVIRKLLKTYPAYKFVAIALFFMFTSGVLFDLYIVYHPVMEEVYEMNAAISMVFAAIAIVAYSRTERANSSRSMGSVSESTGASRKLSSRNK